MNNGLDLTGEVFGRLKVLGFAENRKRSDGFNEKYWNCLCQCGKQVIVSSHNLRRGSTKSCGCLRLERVRESITVHGFCNRNEKTTPLYGVWLGMKQRCYNENEKAYKHYGGRGIEVCDEWRNSFDVFYIWAMENGYKEGLTIDRIDVNGDYEPSNCRWATRYEQNRNKRDNDYIEYNGERRILADWAKYLGIERLTLWSRINRSGWSIEKAFTTPVRKQAKNKPIDTQPEIC